jgi:hypothetical protein
MPLPPYRLEIDTSACPNSWKSFSLSLGDIPMPLSSIMKRLEWEIVNGEYHGDDKRRKVLRSKKISFLPKAERAIGIRYTSLVWKYAFT